MRIGNDKRRGWGVVACLVAPLFLASCTSLKQPPQNTPPTTPPVTQQGQAVTPSPAVSKAVDGAPSEAEQSSEDAVGRQLPRGLKPIRMNLQGEELEQTCDALSAQIADIIKTRNFTSTEWTPNAERMFPKMKLVWRMFNHTATPEEIAADPESELVYKYLLSSDDRIQYTLQVIASFVCWGRLDRVWFAIFDKPSNDTMVDWGKCPLVGLPYVADASQVSCPQHGISFTFPDHTARPQIDQLMLQFISGDFTAKRRHSLDGVLLKDKVSAVQMGEVVADIGCGVGSYTVSIAEGVGQHGQVFATDINDDVLNFVDYVSKEKNLPNITTYKVSSVDPGLRAASLDRAFMIDVFNSIAGEDLLAQRQLSTRSEKYLKKVCEALKPGGKLVLVEGQPDLNNPHVPAPVASNCLSGFGLQEVEWHEFKALGNPLYVLTMQKPVEPPVQQ